MRAIAVRFQARSVRSEANRTRGVIQVGHWGVASNSVRKRVPGPVNALGACWSLVWTQSNRRQKRGNDVVFAPKAALANKTREGIESNCPVDDGALGTSTYRVLE